jgi:hydrogenase/urease accessory protein HupE
MTAPRFCLALVALIAALLAPRAGRAHDESVSASDLVISDQQLIWKLDVGLAGLAKRIDFGRAATGGELALIEESEIAAHRQAIADYLQRGLQVFLDGQLVSAQVGELTPLRESLEPGGPPRITRVSLELRFSTPSRQTGPGPPVAAPRTIQQVRARLGLFSDLTSVHRAVLKVRWGDESTQLARLGVSEVVLDRGRLNPGPWLVAWDFLRWGAHHIFIGYDHIAFLLALLLAVTRLRSLFFIITAFTVAHSLTILLAALDVVRMPPRITEALIAASIVWVALENIVLGMRPRPRRWLLTFAFGLVHGLGFAEVLRERLAEAPGGVLLPVITFNVGVELGQAVLVAIAFPMLLWLRRGAGGLLAPEAARTRQERILRLGSIPIALLGLFWLAQRLM